VTRPKYLLITLLATLSAAIAVLVRDTQLLPWLTWLILILIFAATLIELGFLPRRGAGLQLEIDNIPNPIFIKDCNGVFLGVNRAFEEATGLTRSAVVGKTTTDFSSVAEAAIHIDNDRTLLANGGLATYKSTVSLPNGQKRTFLYKKAALRRQGKLVGLVGSFIDVTSDEAANRRLAASEEAYQTIVETANEGIWIIDSHGDTTFVNARMAQMLGYTVDQFMGRSMFDFMDEAAKIDAQRNMDRRSEGLDEVHDFRFQHRDGKDRWFIVGTRARIDEDGQFTGALGMLTDITARKQAEAELLHIQQDLEAQVQARTDELQLTNQQLVQRQRAIDASAHGIVIGKRIGSGFIVDYANAASEWLTGLPSQEAIGRPWRGLTLCDPVNAEADRITAAIIDGSNDNAIVEILHADGNRGWCHLHVSAVGDGIDEATHFVLASYDITSLRQSEERIEHLNNFDMPTGLPNAATFTKNLLMAFDLAGKLGHCVHLAIFDIDHSRHDDDRFGEHRSDKLLRELTTRLSNACDATDVIARLGNNRFAIMAPRSRIGIDSFTNMVHYIQQQIALPLEVDGQQLKISCSVGLVTYPEDGVVPNILIERASMATHHARSQGHGVVARYDHSMTVAAQNKIAIDIALGKAVERDDFFLQYQPQIDLATRRTVGFEALLRWDNAELGSVSPARFIPLLEVSGDIVLVGQRVLQKACQQAQKFNATATTPLHMSVNLSPRQFSDERLVDCVKLALDSSGLSPDCLIIEITESVLVHDIDRAIATMHALRAIGVGLSIDDFGTGYSSLAYLKRFPLTELKIDQSFVRDIMTDPGDALIVSSVINLARSLGLQVVAEGVETEDQLGFLTSHGCNIVQGYLFSRPRDAADLLVS
jgi:PAS domain S-box-containing protein/diguanylate cyclase (GGDEF)-like protein